MGKPRRRDMLVLAVTTHLSFQRPADAAATPLPLPGFHPSPLPKLSIHSLGFKVVLIPLVTQILPAAIRGRRQVWLVVPKLLPNSEHRGQGGLLRSG